MIEDPRNNPPAEADSGEDEVYDDEISLDELEGDPSDFMESDDPEPQAAPQPSDQPEAPPEPDALDDEVTIDELDEESAGYFEVFASPASPEGGAAAPGADENMYEVQAAPGPRQSTNPTRPTTQSAATGSSSDADSIRRLHNVEVEVIATLGSTRMQIRDILGLHVGSVVELHRMVGEPVDVTLNGRLIARGEVVVVDEKFAIRVHEITGNGE